MRGSNRNYVQIEPIGGNMLEDLDVAAAVSHDLLKKGYSILRKCRADRNDVDIVARLPETGAKLFISAAGVASSRAGREKLAEVYTESQLFHCVSRGIHSAFRIHGDHKFIPGDQIALAFPDTPGFRKYLNAEKPVLDSFGIKVFLVTEEKNVTVL
jgi:hypothetical protein